MMRLSQIWTYPVKSCAGVSLKCVTLGERGLRYDRHWMVVTPQGQMVTLREAPQLIRVKPRFAADHLTVTAPGMASLELAVDWGGAPLKVRAWEGWADAVVVAEASEWFSGYLQRRVCLVAVAPSTNRVMTYGEGSRRIGFADAAPLNILGEASLADLNSRLNSPVGVEQFRPNLVFSGGTPYAEDTWRQVRIGPVLFDVYEACERCMVINIDRDASYAKEPLATLARYRRRGRGVLFSQNLSHLSEGEVSVGDDIRVVHLREGAED